MKSLTFTLSDIEVAYIVGTLRIAFETSDHFSERDQIIIEGLIDKFAARLKFDDDVIARLHAQRRPK